MLNNGDTVHNKYNLLIVRNILVCSLTVGAIGGCSMPKPKPPTVALSPIAAAREARNQCAIYGLKKGTPAYVTCIKRSTNKLLYNNAVAMCGQRSFSNQCGAGVMSEINPTPAQSFEMTECKQRLYNLCIQAASQEYLHQDGQINPFR